MELMLRAAALAAAGTLCACVLRRGAPELALVVTVLTGVCLLMWAAQALESAVDMLSRLTRLAGLEGALSGEAAGEETQALAQAQQAQIAAMFQAWKDRDPEALAAALDKEAVVNGEDELSAKLYTQRDPGMTAAAAEYLETEGENTFFRAVGAGHMVDPGGIVSGLRELGYTVELVP